MRFVFSQIISHITCYIAELLCELRKYLKWFQIENKNKKISFLEQLVSSHLLKNGYRQVPSLFFYASVHFGNPLMTDCLLMIIISSWSFTPVSSIYYLSWLHTVTGYWDEKHFLVLTGFKAVHNTLLDTYTSHCV